MKDSDQSQMHQDHVRWRSEAAMWEQDIRMWYQELQALKNALRSIEQACAAHKEGLDVHARLIKGHQHSLQLKESYLAMIEPSGHRDGDAAAKHLEQEKQHQVQKDAHARLKKYHHLIMVLTKNMKKVLEGPM